MRARLTKVTMVVMGLAAFAFGGASLAGAAGKTTPSKPAVVQDRDSIQQGDQTAPDNTAAEKAGESADPAEAAGSESSSESAAADDGPGGHADEPGNPNADNQFQGAQ